MAKAKGVKKSIRILSTKEKKSLWKKRPKEKGLQKKGGKVKRKKIRPEKSKKRSEKRKRIEMEHEYGLKKAKSKKVQS